MLRRLTRRRSFGPFQAGGIEAHRGWAPSSRADGFNKPAFQRKPGRFPRGEESELTLGLVLADLDHDHCWRGNSRSMTASSTADGCRCRADRSAGADRARASRCDLMNQSLAANQSVRTHG